MARRAFVIAEPAPAAATTKMYYPKAGGLDFDNPAQQAEAPSSDGEAYEDAVQRLRLSRQISN